MKIRNLLFLFIALFISMDMNAQTIISGTVNNANISTTCDDFFGQPDPYFEVNFDGQGWVTYPDGGACEIALPNQQYGQFYCAGSLPATINICFKVYENDGLFGCDITETCTEQICQDFTLPTLGTNNYTLTLPNGGDSSGSLGFSITATPSPLSLTNDEICNAVDLGTISVGGSLGDGLLGQYNNFCAGFANEPDPCADGTGMWCNTNGVWFSFTTGNEIISTATLNIPSDPENIGFPILTQVSTYESLDGTCNDLQFVSNIYQNTINYSCLKANTTYYVGIDGTEDPNYPNEGLFGLQLDADALANAPDLPCDAYDFGAVPLDGLVSLPTPFSNSCAGTPGDPAIINFGSQNSVWFKFSPPATGHILIEGVSQNADEIGLQIAVYSSSTNDCTGNFIFEQGSWTPADLDESLELSCLDPDLTYWILVDGEFIYGTGIFDLMISDAGNITPETTNTYVYCAGGSVNVAGSFYDVSGFYSDTIPTMDGCYEVINTDLTVLEELIIDLQIIDAASGENDPDGEATASAVGGDGNYSFSWSNGSMGASQSTLLGAQNYCVTVTDGNDCEDFICFDMPYIDFILPTVTNGAVGCNGDNDGQISFFIQNGFPPYSYSWTNPMNGMSGNGSIAAEMEVVLLDNLPAGAYTINVSDTVMDTTFTATITEPNILEINALGQIEASCFGVCDGELMVDIVGGTPPYSFQWTNGDTTQNLQNLCAGNYSLTVTDSNNCIANSTFSISEPEEFIATITINNDVTCFAGQDGSATIVTNGMPLEYLWNTGATTATVNDLSAGDYSVLVTNIDGCQTTAILTINQPTEPVAVIIEILQEISCAGTLDGMLRATASGAGNSFTYTWSDGSTDANRDNLPAGNYSVTVHNEVECSATATITITEPEEITTALTTKDVTCISGEFSGEVLVESIVGGIAPYSYSLDGVNFSATNEYTTLAAGNYTLYLEDAVGCLKTYPFSILPPPDLVVDLGLDQDILLGETVNLEPITNSDDLLYTWVSNELLEDCLNENCAELNLQPLNTSTYTVVVVDTLTFCTATASVTVKVDKKRYLFFPTAFSPDNDGINDLFYPYGQRGVAQINTMTIFDRYGGQIFSITNFLPDDSSMSWDGYYKNKEVPSGVYVWIAEIEFIDGVTEMFSGSVTVLR